MVHAALYALNIAALLTGLLVFCLAEGGKRFSLALIQSMLCLPLLVGEYIFLAADMTAATVQLVLFSEIIFAIIWLSMTMNLHRATVTISSGSRGQQLGESVIGGIAAVAAGYFLAYRPVTDILNSRWAFSMYSPVYFSAILLLLTVLYGFWRIEQFWHSLNVAQRWEYKLLVYGSYLVGGTFAWGSSYRLTYLSMEPRHLDLLAALLFLGWIMISYAVVSHRLLNRKIFVSRKVVYSAIIPGMLSIYFLGFGIVILVVRHFEIELSFVLKWLMLFLTLVAILIVITSGNLRRRLQFYISTHFYINKYEYRDEWLALSEQLQGASTEREVVQALRNVLSNSLYTHEIFIWLGDVESARFSGYRCVDFFDSHESVKLSDLTIAPDDPLIHYLKTYGRYPLQKEKSDRLPKETVDDKSPVFAALNLKLLVPISIGNYLVGVIGLGAEFTGGEYGHDDFDLLTALGGQTASALLAIRMAEQLAIAREQQAWNRLSAFVLHDIKNAATMLGLLRENAPKHLREPDFQRDMLDLVDDALKRMSRVELRLRGLQNEITPNWQDLELGVFLRDCGLMMSRKLPSMKISVHCPSVVRLRSDSELLTSVLENLLLNSFEAGGDDTHVRIFCYEDECSGVWIELSDNGPGIAGELLPDRLFEPFTTGKKGGSGIGLWQVKRIITSLGGTISTDKYQNIGARFLICMSGTNTVEKFDNQV